MKRKIVKHGPSSLTVSMPIKWAKKYGLMPGDEIDILEDENSLILTTYKSSPIKKEMIINLDKTKKFMLRLLCGPYLKGYRSIKMYYSDPNEHKNIQKGLKYLIGFEIVEQKQDSTKVEEISSGTYEKFSNILVRLFHIQKSFLEEVNAYLKEPYDNLQDLLDIELTCDRLALYCRRLLNQNIYKPGAETTGLYHIVCLIEQSADELRHIVEYFIENKPKNYKYDNKLDPIFKGLADKIDITKKKVHNYMDKKDHDQQVKYALEQRAIRTSIKTDPNSFMKGLSKENLYVYWHLINISENIQHMSEELF